MTIAQPKLYVGRHADRSPWLAVNLSVVLPGLGQIYAGAVARGIVIAIAWLLLLSFAIWSVFDRSGNTLTGLLMLLPIVSVYFWNLVDAYRTLTTEPAYLTLGEQAPKDPWYAVFLSQILPGLGNLYHQQSLMGGAFLVLGIATGYFANFHPRLLLMPPLIWATACAHVYLTTQRRSRQGRYLAIILVGLVLGRSLTGSLPLVVRHYLEQCIVPSGSMLPTLQVNDRLFVRKVAGYQPHRQDVVVFRAPQPAIATLQLEPGTLLVKRVVGLPGQAVEIHDGQVLIDGQALVEPYLSAPPDYRWGPETVPPNNLFVLGDNRNDSGDSHIWGFLPQQNLLGKAYKIYWPPNRIQPLP